MRAGCLTFLGVLLQDLNELHSVAREEIEFVTADDTFQKDPLSLFSLFWGIGIVE